MRQIVLSPRDGKVFKPYLDPRIHATAFSSLSERGEAARLKNGRANKKRQSPKRGSPVSTKKTVVSPNRHSPVQWTKFMSGGPHNGFPNTKKSGRHSKSKSLQRSPIIEELFVPRPVVTSPNEPAWLTQAAAKVGINSNVRKSKGPKKQNIIINGEPMWLKKAIGQILANQTRGRLRTERERAPKPRSMNRN